MYIMSRQHQGLCPQQAIAQICSWPSTMANFVISLLHASLSELTQEQLNLVAVLVQYGFYKLKPHRQLFQCNHYKATKPSCTYMNSVKLVSGKANTLALVDGYRQQYVLAGYRQEPRGCCDIMQAPKLCLAYYRQLYKEQK